ncbi:Coenzyme F420 hydrogenase/dehydrogenase, beta subunit C-terminal domain [Thermophagus xiamenensis]|uniref:Coenzyme F420-reducing hydrogenase, beta subunit n=1 Tax=Thermophagus xiamenensis TaxID=385682 RepID=A0A1I2DNF1_9BACT|nr:Coenzyme F420 hydrogenase/dehydrogenase, beta subunit C-terminal domain [Thermophagus xiamenensis]SFE81997.1 Coenzyme F420-reducing hydrogenase, beta subunit [Thermophagus xiamenensis]
MNIPKVLGNVVNNDLCIGCGLCVYICPNNALEMKWNKYGFLIPELSDKCDSNGACLLVCPFNPFPNKEVRTENELAESFLKRAPKYHKRIGKYFDIYAGYSKEFRLNSSSGGIATFILSELLERGIVDNVFCVKESTKKGVYYEYGVSHSKEELINSSKTKYFPVSLSEVMSKIQDLKGKIAVVGVGCFIKAVRLAQHKKPELKEKIPFLVGIICGGVKSSFFTEYLAEKSGVLKQNIEKPKYRIKNIESTAGDYLFGCINKNRQSEHTLRMRSVGDMWGTGLFKANACDFCDDVTTELADVSLGDAWLPPYDKDGAGTNVIVTRSFLANEIIQSGIKDNKLVIESLALERFLTSQQGSFNHRHLGLSFRLKIAKKKGFIPPKRFNEKISFSFMLVQRMRMIVRRKSLELWNSNPNAVVFDKKMRKFLLFLKYLTKVYHYWGLKKRKK